MVTLTVVAGQGNPGGDDSLHPEHSTADHAANKIVHVPCVIGSHRKHVGVRGYVIWHIHFSTYYWNEDSSEAKLACGMAHDDQHGDVATSTDWGDYGTVTYNTSSKKFEHEGSGTTGRGKYIKGWINYCNELIDEGGGDNDGAYPQFEGVRDICKRYFDDIREAVRDAPGGM